MNHTGYHSLCELLTRAFLSKDDEYRGQIEEVWFDEEGATEGLILLTGGPDGRLGRLISLGMEKRVLRSSRNGQNASLGDSMWNSSAQGVPTTNRLCAFWQTWRRRLSSQSSRRTPFSS